MPFSSFFLSISEKHRARKYAKDIHTLIEMLQPAKNDVILDVGAGTGWIASVVANHCDETYALEPNETRLEYIKKKHPAVKAFSGTAQTVPFPERYFDKLYAIFSLHHFPDPEDSLEEFSRILKPNGKLLIQEFYNSKPKFFERREIKFMNPEELEEVLNRHGFRKEDQKKVESGYFMLSRNELP